MATGEVQLVKVVEGMDVDLGKVEIVDSGGTNTADVNDASATRTTTTHVMAVQHIDATGNVINISDASSARATTTDVLPVQQIDAAGTVGGVTLNTLIAGEDQTNDVLKVEKQYSYANVTASGATAVKTSAGFLHAITFNAPASGVTTVITDASAAGGTIVATITPETYAVATGQPFTLIYDVKCLSGITASQVSATATGSNLTVSYR